MENAIVVALVYMMNCLLGCVTISGIGSIQIFTLEGYFVTSLREFKIKLRSISIKDPSSLHLEEADGELAIFLCNPLYNSVFCITGNRNYCLDHDKPSDIKSDRFVLFVLRSNFKVFPIVYG